MVDPNVWGYGEEALAEEYREDLREWIEEITDPEDLWVVWRMAQFEVKKQAGKK